MFIVKGVFVDFDNACYDLKVDETIRNFPQPVNKESKKVKRSFSVLNCLKNTPLVKALK